MKRPKSTGLFLLGIYLVATALMEIVGIRLGHLSILMPLLAVAAGICLLPGK